MTAEEVLEIPGNRRVFEDLKKLLQEGYPIAFVGAGASAGLYPLWPQFIEMLVDHTVSEGLADLKASKRWKADKVSTPQQRVSRIVRELGEDRYRRFLKDTFKPVPKRFTETHGALLRLPFRGYVTTNYDPGLEFARTHHRPTCLTTGTPTWQDDDEVHAWLTGDVLREPESCPILWLHGYWQRPNGIVLNAGEYAEAYKSGIYRRTFERLWLQDHLIFVGFGLNDPSFTFMVSEMLRDISHAHAEPRHIAILGIECEPGTLPDRDEIREKREELEADYHVRPIFYPSYGRDHSALQLLLDHLAEPYVTAKPTVSIPVASPKSKIQAKWVHETSNDDRFTGREEEIDRLNRWVADSSVSAIGVSAVGGTGKTALIGHWLKETADWQTRPFVGLFAWSFYQNPSAADFLVNLVVWAEESLGLPKPRPGLKLPTMALSVLESRPILVLLDGLEVIQNGQDGEKFGRFLDWDLREFFSGFCEERCDSLAVLTSRFTFADLERFLGTSFRQLELLGLPPEQAAELLYEMEVRGSSEERVQISERLEGHPLLLRVFAESLPDDLRGSPLRFLEDAFSPEHLPLNASLGEKMRRLLVFYDETLSVEQKRVLSIVSLFRRPVTEETIERLAGGMFEIESPLASGLINVARTLHRNGILSSEPVGTSHGYACHPILRDHFRSTFLSGSDGQGKKAANLFAGEPSRQSPRTIEAIEPILLAIEILLDANEFEVADDLYRNRLENGSLFRWIPALSEGLRCASKFLGADALQEHKKRLAFFHNAAGLYASNSGIYKLASKHFEASLEIYRDRGDLLNVCISLQNLGVFYCRTGRPRAASYPYLEANDVAFKLSDWKQIRNTHAHLGWVDFMCGRCRDAAFRFAKASAIERHLSAVGNELYSLRGLQKAEFLAHCSRLDIAESATQANLIVCEWHQWNEDIARCHWVLGVCALKSGRLDQATKELGAAEETLERGQMVFDLARLHVTAGYLAIAQSHRQSALSRAQRALDLAAPRGMRLVHSDAVVLLGRARMLSQNRGEALRAFDDAEAALQIARDCGYPWAERDALFLQADALELSARLEQITAEVKNRTLDRAKRARAEAQAIAAKLILTDQDLEDAEEAAEEELKRLLEAGKIED